MSCGISLDIGSRALHIQAQVSSRKSDDMLDRPVWAALSTRHLRLSVGGALARRYAPDVNLFASARDDTRASLGAPTDLVQPGERVFLLQVPDILVPSGLVSVKAAKGVQMVATRRVAAAAEDDIVELTEADAPEMLVLAKLTEPEPFLARTHTMEPFAVSGSVAGSPPWRASASAFRATRR